MDVKNMVGTIDDALEDFANHPNMAWARQGVVVGTDASNAENRLFELLGMDLEDAMWAAPFSVTEKSDIAYVLLMMVDDRKGMDFCLDVRLTHNGEMVRPMDVVGYEAAKRIADKVIAWAARNGEETVKRNAEQALGYRQQAEWQEAARRVLEKVDERGVRQYDVLEGLLESAGCPRARRGDSLVESVADYIRDSMHHIGDKEGLRNRHVPKVARQMKESGMQLSGSRRMGASSTSRMSAAASSSRTERYAGYGAPGKAAEADPEAEAHRLVQRALDSNDYNAKWRQKAVREGAIDALLHRLAKAGSNGDAAHAFRSVLNRIGDWGNLRQLKRMKELGCDISDSMIRDAEEGMGMTRPVEGGRRRLVRNITVSQQDGKTVWTVSRATTILPDGREVFRIARRKGKPGGLTNGEKRRQFAREREARVKVRLRA